MEAELNKLTKMGGEVIRYAQKYLDDCGGSLVREKVVLRGNPDVIGTVTHIRQIHAYKQGPFGIEMPPNEADFATGFYQLEILKYLEDNSFDAVFTEGSSSSEIKYDAEESCKFIAAEFPEGVPDNPTPKQLMILHAYGAAHVYAIMHQDAILIGAEDKELLAKANDLVSDSNIRQESLEGRVATMYVRERCATQKVRKYLDAHPGARVALVFGALHSFRFDFRRDLEFQGAIQAQFGQRKSNDVPQLREVDFPYHTQIHRILQIAGVPENKWVDFAVKIRMHIDILQGSHTRRKASIAKTNPSVQKKTHRLLET
jgi:hypothetical protein